MREINDTNWEFARRLFHCVAVAARPLRVEELAEILAFDFESGPIPNFCEGWRPPNPVDAVLSTCSTLLAIVYERGSPVVQFAHFSVKEYLTSARLAEANDKISRRYHVSMTHAHTLVAQACLGILLHLDQNITRDSLKKFPLAEYAATHWAGHSRIENVSQKLEDGMKQLFDASKPHFAIWVWIHDQGFWIRGQRPFPPIGTPLHYAALYGLHAITRFLVTEQSLDVNSQSIHNNFTPLHLTSWEGHVENAHVLLEVGADARAQDNDEQSPLHQASYKGHVEVVRVLLEGGADARAQDKRARSPLHRASSEGHVEVARMLLEGGADASARDISGRSSLYQASLEGHVEVARVLLKAGADAGAQDKDGRSPLHLASCKEVASVLLEAGVDANTQDKYGWSPLHWTVSEGHLHVARVLLQYDADRATHTDQRVLTVAHHLIT